MSRAIHCLVLAVSLALAASGQARAQTAPQVPGANSLTILVRTIMIALNDANRTGNYTVFRQLGSPGFRTTNSAADLALIFAKLRERDLDFGPVVLFNPQFTKQPVLNKDNMLRLTGFFATRPLRLHFDLAYQWTEKRWRVFGISVHANQAPVETPTR